MRARGAGAGVLAETYLPSILASKTLEHELRVPPLGGKPQQGYPHEAPEVEITINRVVSGN